MQRSSSHLRNVSADPRAREPITEPWGPGPFAEAMRELIADLRTVPDSEQLSALKPANAPVSRPWGARHLRLVR